MKRVIYALLAVAMLVACSEDKAAAEKQMADYKAQWVEITSLMDAKAVELLGFDAWYNTLTNSEVRDLNAAKEAFDASYEEVEHWYKNLSDGEQEAARAAGVKWEEENPALQTQIELFEAHIVVNEDIATRELIRLTETIEDEAEVSEECCAEGDSCTETNECGECPDCVDCPEE